MIIVRKAPQIEIGIEVSEGLNEFSYYSSFEYVSIKVYNFKIKKLRKILIKRINYPI